MFGVFCVVYDFDDFLQSMQIRQGIVRSVKTLVQFEPNLALAIIKVCMPQSHQSTNMAALP
jgi:hypothetical protein